MFQLCLVIVVVNVDVKLDFLEFLSRGISPLCLQIFLLFVLKLAEIHDPDHRRRRTVRHQHEIFSRLLRKFPRSRIRNHSQLLAVRTNQTDQVRRECPIVRFQQLSNNGTLPS